MKVSINQVKINRVGINTACIQGVRLGSASKGGQTSPFHPSLVDYWNFKGKSNADEDRNVIKGIKGEILTAYNFGWSLGSGYGLYKTNFLQWDYISSRGTAVVTSDTIHLTETFGNANVIEFNNLSYKFENITVDVTGDFGGVNLIYYYYISETEASQIVINTPGRYELPKTNRVNGGFRTNRATKLDLTIEQIPEYEGAIVTDGIDDYLQFNNVNDYAIGTVIIKAIPLTVTESSYVFDVERKRTYFRYLLNTDNTIRPGFSFNSKRVYGNYDVLRYNDNNIANIYTPMFIGCRFNINEYISMALYEIAIYQDVLTDEEIQKEIKVMEYGTPNPVFALNFDNFAYKAVDYPDFATGKATTNKIVVNSTTATFNGFIAAAYNPELTTGDAIELPSYKVKVTGIDAYSNLGDGYWAVALMGMPIDTSQDPWVYLFHKDGIYDIPAISLSDGIFNLSVMCQITVDKPIEIEILYDKNIAKSFPETKQIFP
ncbi:hypothetical protein OXV71_14415 [Bacteroides fragilis]|nr:hypothetical protein [Bacteroides fragilis]